MSRIRMGRPRINQGTCSVDGCDKPALVGHLCSCHYYRKKRHGDVHADHSHSPRPKLKMKCLVTGCTRMVGTNGNGYCRLHYRRLKSGISLNRAYGNLGELNPRWNGGKSEYPNHYLLKKVRKEVLEEANYICYYCGGIADRVHHKDLSKDNHKKENLRVCCHKCNMKFRKDNKNLLDKSV